MKMYVINLLMRNATIILQHIIILCASSLDQFLQNRQDLGQLIIWYISQFFTVEFGDHEGVAFGEGIDVEEGEDGGGFVELEGGDVSFDDLAEDAGCHFGTSCRPVVGSVGR